jgi:hypothetical protein
MSSPPPGTSLDPAPGPADPPARIGIRTSPRDLGDALVVAFLVVVGVGIVATPIAIWHDDPNRLFIVLNWFLGVGVAILLAYAAVNITAVVVDGQGICLHRWHGWDRKLAWDQIDAVRPVGRGEALLVAFCMPWRATHWGLSSLDVFCIHWSGRRFYFPAADGVLFRQAVRRWRPGLLPGDEPGGNAPPVEETGNPYQPPRT